MNIRQSTTCVSGLIIAASAGVMLGGATAAPNADSGAAQSSPDASATGTVTRVSGDLQARIDRDPAGYRFGPALIDTPLPESYPEPTPPGAIDLKRYPSVRRAEVSGAMLPDIGMNTGFWPLFNHIQRRSIEMTSPVEMDYVALADRDDNAGDANAPQTPRWTMSFLYRTPDLGPTGTDGDVTIVDTPPVTVVSLGFTGSYGATRVERGVRELERWLDAQTQWERSGSPRALFYNGPDRRPADRWGEVQIPVRLRALTTARSEPNADGNADDGSGRRP